MAEQLDSLDEESLMGLWNKYASKVQDFQPTREWETACLVLSLIQAKHMKNRLFNCRLAMRLAHNAYEGNSAEAHRARSSRDRGPSETITEDGDVRVDWATASKSGDFLWPGRREEPARKRTTPCQELPFPKD